MKTMLMNLLQARDMTKYRLGKLMGFEPLYMGTLYQTIDGKRVWRVDYLSRILRTIDEVRSISKAESDQIVRALLEAGNDEQ